MEKRKSVDQRRLEVDQFFSKYSAELADQGTIAASFRERSGRRLGPYYRLTCRVADQRQVSVYLGTEGPVVEETRRRLDPLQAEARRRRRWRQMRQALRREMKVARRRLADELSKQGLVAKGAEIRGWRQLGKPRT